jgi:hypothetical protein
VWLHGRVITRPTSAIVALAVAGTLAASLASCSSGGNTNGHGSAGGPTPTTAAQLGTKLLSASQSITSAHVTLDITVAGVTIHGSGDEKLSKGALVAMDMTEGVPAVGNLRIIRVAGKTYMKLPAKENPSGKPYVLVSPQSSNPIVQQLAGSIDTAASTASIKAFNAFVRAAKSIKVDGRETVDGVGATHYSVVVDPAKVPNTSALSKQALAASGLKTVPVDLWVDDQGRPVKMTVNLHVQGQVVKVVAQMGHYNQPVTITAPPASQVSTN